MNTRVKTTLSLLIVCLMIVGIAGCGGAPGGAATTAAGATAAAASAAAPAATTAAEAATTAGASTDAQEPAEGGAQKTFHIAIRSMTSDRWIDDYNQKEIFKLAEEGTGIRIEWTTVPAGSEAERIPIMLASDLPDAFQFLLGEDTIVKNTRSFVNLDPLLPEHAPHLMELYETIPDFWDMMRFPDGNIYSLPTGFSLSYENDPEGIIFINTDWMETLGFEMPTNSDEFYEMCLAMYENDPNGNGQQDEIPITFQAGDWVGGILYHANPWGIAGRGSSDSSAYFKIEGGKVVSNLDTPQMRAFLEYYNRMAKEGLLDVEGFSQTGAQRSAKIDAGVVGMYSGWMPGGDNVNIYKAIEPFDAVGFEGQYRHHGQYQRFRGHRTGFAITSACDDPAALLGWWEYLHTDTKVCYTGRYGAEGILWEMRDDGKIYTVYGGEGPDGMGREDMKYTYGLVDMGPLILPSEPEINDPEKYPDSIHRQYACDTYLGHYMEEFLPIRFVSPDKRTELTFIETEINDYMASFIANSITGTIDDATWEAHIQQLEALNQAGWLQWYQDMVDGVF